MGISEPYKQQMVEKANTQTATRSLPMRNIFYIIGVIVVVIIVLRLAGIA
ncbi:MAG: hypothetical protein AAGH82_03690 [Pseudomonadota bacterium]